MSAPGYEVRSPCGRVWFVPFSAVTADYAAYLVQADGLTKDAADAKALEACDVEQWFSEQFNWTDVKHYGTLIKSASPEDIETALNCYQANADTGATDNYRRADMQPAPATEQARFETALDAVYPVYDGPHTSVTQRALDNRTAFKKGWLAATQAERVQQLQEQLDLANEHLRQAVENIAKMKAAERVQSSGSIDTPELRKLVNEYREACGMVQGHAVPQWRNLVRHIEACRATASKAETAVACNAALRAAPAMPVDAGSATQPAWEPVTRAGQVKVGDKLRFKIGDGEYRECAKLILNAGTDKEEVIYNKRENFYFITSMVLNGRSNHKGVEVLAANTKEGTQ